MIGEKYEISGMTLEIISDQGEQWEMINLTTRETIAFNKDVLSNAIKLGKAEKLSDFSEHK